MIKLFKKIVKKVLASRNLEIIPINEYIHKLERVKNDWLVDMKIQTIIDVGASDGGFAKKIKEVIPNARLYCFEALEDIFEILNANIKDLKDVITVNLAMSDQIGPVSFYRCVDWTGSSSMLEMNDIHKTAYPFTANTQEVKVNASTLDHYFESNTIVRPAMLKIDVQGAEMFVLKGAKNVLENIDIVFCEINFVETYNNCVLFNELNSFLYERGFILSGMENVSQSTVDGSFLQADAYFVRNKSF